jgi:ribosome-associated toxin RatA of RatAB toxin-antitoxin module
MRPTTAPVPVMTKTPFGLELHAAGESSPRTPMTPRGGRLSHEVRGGLFHRLASAPLWCEARQEEAESAQMLAALGRRASEASVIGTRTQVLAALYVQERWRQRQQQQHQQQCTPATASGDELLGDDALEVTVEIHVDISLDLDEEDDAGQPAPHRSPAQAAPTLPPPPQPPAQPAPAVVAASSDQAAVEKEMTVASRSVADVFAVVAGFEDYPKWVSGLQKVETLERDEATGRGSVVRFTAGAMGLTIQYTLQYTAYIGEGGSQVLAWRSIAGGVKSIEGSYHLSPTDEGSSGAGPRPGATAEMGAAAPAGTRVRYKLNVDTGFKMPAMLRRTATGLIIGAALPDLKRHLERGGGVHSTG